MSIEMIRSHRYEKNNKHEKRTSIADSTQSTLTTFVTIKKQQNPEPITTSNLLQSDQSTITLDQWNLLSNLVHCFDENSGYTLVESFIEEQNRLPLKLRFKYSLVYDFFYINDG
ncbi:unnamed protein product [Rotaria sp. Silwood1]|nr:unnamed protein product [Rotaria sp. Silwood1]